MKAEVYIRVLMSAICLILFNPLYGQALFNVGDIYKKNEFAQRSVYNVQWMNDGAYFTSRVNMGGQAAIVKFNTESGLSVDTLIKSHQIARDVQIDDYAFNNDESIMLIAVEMEPVYRRSTRAFYYIFDPETETASPLRTDGRKQSFATFSPDGNQVAYMTDNNLYIYDVSGGSTHAVTRDGKKNELIHGGADWVYEEEFSITKTFVWSPDSRFLLYLSFDERLVSEYNMQAWGTGLYPEDYRFKYPKAGEKNAMVTITSYDVANRKHDVVQIPEVEDSYIPRLEWAGDALAIITWLNRQQNELKLYGYDPESREVALILKEESPTYVDIDYNDKLLFIGDGTFLRTSEADGYKHIYHHEQNGELISQLTDGDWEVTELLGYDKKNKKIWFISTRASSLERHLYTIDVKGKKLEQISSAPGVHSYNISRDFSYYLDFYTPANGPLIVDLLEAGDHKMVRRLESNRELEKKLRDYKFTDKEYFTFETTDEMTLNGYMIKPYDFDPSRQYPVLMFVYGGPGSQQVLKRFNGTTDAWHQMLAQMGVIVVCVDNRGTGGRGKLFKHITYSKLGRYESADQVHAAGYLSKLPYVDGSRIGIWGWSYGGYLSSLCILTSPDVFSMAIAVAPVTNWRFYDSIYTERYLGLPDENERGYDEYSPITHAAKLEGNLMLVHGTGDDNVHLQNTIHLVNALVEAGKPFDLQLYPDKNHGLYGGNTRYHLFTQMTGFVEDNLLR